MFELFGKRSYFFLVCCSFLFNARLSLFATEAASQKSQEKKSAVQRSSKPSHLNAAPNPSRQFSYSSFDLDTSFLHSPLDTDVDLLPNQTVDPIDSLDPALPEKTPTAPLPISEKEALTRDGSNPKIPVTQLTGNLLCIANHFNKYESNFVQTISQLNADQIQNALVDLSSIQYTSVNYMIDQLLCVDLIGKVRSRGFMHRSPRTLTPSPRKPPKTTEEKELREVTAANFEQVHQRGNQKQINKESQNYVFWGDLFGNIQKQARQNQFPDLYSESVGTLVGFEVVGLRQGWVGATAGYARTYFGDQNNFGSTSTNSYFLGLYGAGYPGIVFLECALFGGFNNTKSKQNLYFGETKISTQASFDSAEVAPHFSVGYDIGWEWAVLEPYLSLDFVNNWIFNFREHNDFKKVSFSDSSMLRAELGFHAYQETKNMNSTYSFQETVGFVNKTFFRMGRTKTSFSFLSDSPPLVITDFKSPQNLFTFGLNFLFRNRSGFFSSFNYQGEFGSKFFLNDLHLDLGLYF